MSDEGKELRAKTVAAKAALFALEEALGPSGNEDRRKVYRLRVELGYILYEKMKQLAGRDVL